MTSVSQWIPDQVRDDEWLEPTDCSRFRLLVSKAMIKQFASLFGYADYVRNPRSGRPEAPLSWQREPFFTWLAWGAAIIGIVGEASYFWKWGVFDGSLGGAAIFFGAIAFVRRRAFARKKQELSAALESYERAFRI